MHSNATGSVAESDGREARTAVFFDSVREAVLPTQFGYALTADAEIWDPITGATREDAARAAFDAELFVSEIFICERQFISKVKAFEWSVHVESMLDDADSAAYEHLYAGNGSIFESDPVALDALKARIVTACADWLREHPGPDVWTAVNVTTHARERVTQ